MGPSRLKRPNGGSVDLGGARWSPRHTSCALRPLQRRTGSARERDGESCRVRTWSGGMGNGGGGKRRGRETQKGKAGQRSRRQGGGPGQPILRRRRQWSRRCCGQPAREVSWSLRKPPALDALPIPLILNSAAPRCCCFCCTAGPVPCHSTLRKGKLMRHGSGMHSARFWAKTASGMFCKGHRQNKLLCITLFVDASVDFAQMGTKYPIQRLDEPTPPRSPPAPCSSALCADWH